MPNLKTNFLPFLVLLVANCGLHAQARDTAKKSTCHTRNIFWTTPVFKNTTINGLCLSPALAMGWNVNDTGVHYLTINGLNIELSAFGLFAIPAGVFSVVYALTPKHFGNGNYPHSASLTRLRAPSALNGVTIGLGGFCMPAANGLMLNGTVCAATNITGLEISGVLNLNYQFKGVMIAGVENVATYGHGLQIALINKCKSGKLVQIGLINRIGKRVTPLVNFSL